jgi:hypothetical protein
MYLIAHFCSCNLGDKHQAFRIISRLPDIVFQCVNFSDNSTYEESWEERFDNKTVRVYNPSKIDTKKYPSALFLTGSFDNNSPHVPLMKAFIANSVRIVIWGGFHGVNPLFVESMKWLDVPNVFFFGRGKDDVDMFKTISYGGQAELGGDPMMTLVPPNIGIKVNKRIAILSCYLYYHNKTLLDTVLEDPDISAIICIDTCSDKDKEFLRYISDKSNAFVIVTNCPKRVLELLETCSMVYSSRLHGCILAFQCKIPVVMLSTDGARRGYGSFKYHSVACSGVGDGGNLCNIVVNSDELRKLRGNERVFSEAVLQYKRQTLKTIETIRVLLNNSS